jgi:hypothetical protein
MVRVVEGTNLGGVLQSLVEARPAQVERPVQIASAKVGQCLTIDPRRVRFRIALGVKDHAAPSNRFVLARIFDHQF